MTITPKRRTPKEAHITYVNGDVTLYLQRADITKEQTETLAKAANDYGFLLRDHSNGLLTLTEWFRQIERFAAEWTANPKAKDEARPLLNAIAEANKGNPDHKPRPMIRQPFDGWKTSVYKTHCKTSKLAGELANNTGNISSIEDALSQKPPFCLRVVKEHRTQATKEFRNLVAREMSAQRTVSRPASENISKVSADSDVDDTMGMSF